jgi:DNA repair exonuclease SbcCD ATPase subunit
MNGMALSPRFRASSARAHSARHQIVTPKSSVNAARFQASYAVDRHSSSHSARSHVTKHQFAHEIEQFIQTGLGTASSPVGRFAVYQEAFRQLIDACKNYQEPMLKIKQGYDDIISKLVTFCHADSPRAMETQRSMTQLDSLVVKQQIKYETKRQYYIDLQAGTEDNIAALHQEIAELQSRIRRTALENRAQGQQAHQQWQTLQELIGKNEKKQSKVDKLEAERRSHVGRRRELEQKVEDAHAQIAETLDSILARKRQINGAEKSIRELNTEISKVEEAISKRKELIEEGQQQMDKLWRASKDEEDEMETVKSQNTDLLVLLNELARTDVRGLLFSGQESDDPIVLVRRFIDNNAP